MNTTTQNSEKTVLPVVLPVDLRDYFAAKAMPTCLQMLSDGLVKTNDGETVKESAARAAYEIADAMLAARGKS